MQDVPRDCTVAAAGIQSQALLNHLESCSQGDNYVAVCTPMCTCPLLMYVLPCAFFCDFKFFFE